MHSFGTSVLKEHAFSKLPSFNSSIKKEKRKKKKRRNTSEITLYLANNNEKSRSIIALR